MRRDWNSTSWVLCLVLGLALSQEIGRSSPILSLQEDGSLVVSDAKGSISDFVKQGTPRQSIQIGGQSCNVSYGFNSAGKKTILVSVPSSASSPIVFELGDNEVTIPAKSALRLVLGADNRLEKMDANPAETVRFTPIPSPQSSFAPAPPTMPTRKSSAPLETAPRSSSAPSLETLPPPAPVQSNDPSAEMEWPGKMLTPPIPEGQKEEDQFYVRTEFGPRFMSSLNLVSVSGPSGSGANNYSLLNQKEIAFSTGYRQDIDLGVWLTDWFGLSVETGFALNAIRGNTQGMSVSSSTFWTVPLLAQLCFQYPNDSGWIPYLNFGFGGGWTIFKVGGINYTQPGGASIPAPLSGTGNSVNNAYQIAAGVRYRLYEELSITLAYKFYGNSQANINLDNGVQATLGSPVTSSVEAGLNFSY